MATLWKSLKFIGFLILATQLSSTNGSFLEKSENQNAVPGEFGQSNEEIVDDRDLERNVREDTEAEEAADETDLARNIREDTEGQEEIKYESDDETDHSAYKRGAKAATPQNFGKPDNAIDDFLVHVFNFGTKHTLGTLTLFGVPHIDPIKVPDVDFGKSHFLGHASGYAKNVEIKGAAGLTLNNLHTSLENGSLHFELSVPDIVVTGLYNLTGKVAWVLPLHGDGPFNIRVDDIHFHFGGNMTIQDPISITLDLCKVSLNQLVAKFDNLMGNGSLGNKINAAVGTVSTKLFKLIEPKLCDVIRGTLEELLNKAMSGVKLPDSIRGLFNGAMGLINKLRGIGRKKRSVTSDENFKIGMLPYLYPKHPEKTIQGAKKK